MLKVSIIAGIYNVSRFLREKRLACIFNQSYKNWELILVDDGSTDDSGYLCDDFAKKDGRVRVIHKENGGLGSARNAGLAIATGDYIWFYDVDDEAYPELLEYGVAEMQNRQLDMLQFSFRAITPSLHIEEDVHLHERMIKGQEQLKNSYIDDILLVRNGNGFAWNKFYSRSFIERHHLRYENQRIQQDEVFNLKCYPFAERIYLSPKVLYDYYIYGSGNTGSHFIPNRFDIYVSVRNQFESLRRQWDITDKRFDDYLHKRFYSSIDHVLRFNLFHPDCQWTTEEKIREMKRVMNHPYTRDAIKYLKNSMSFESQLYLHAYRHYYLHELQWLVWIFSNFRKLKNWFR